MTPLELILPKLKGVRRVGSGWMATCPAHEDKRPSLAINEAGDGRVLLKCFAGCGVDAICAALGLRKAELFPEQGHGYARGMKRPVHPNAKPARKMYPTAREAVAELEWRNDKRSALWTYHDAAGEPVGVVVRWNRPDGSKDIRPVSRTAAGWIIGAMRAPRPLYQLPELLKDQTAGVYVCEGEKAADAAVAVGLLATTSSGGAKAASKTDWSPLAGRNVTLVPDGDDAGRGYADDVAALLAKLTPAPTVKVIELPNLPPGGDVVEHIEARHAAGLDDDAIRMELNRLADTAESIAPDEPELALPSIEPWRPFPVEALPQPMRGFVRAVALATNTDPSFAAIAALVTAAGCVGNRAAAIVKRGWSEPAVLWGVLVGASGTIKTHAMKPVVRALVDIFKLERAAFIEAAQNYEVDRQRYEAQLAEWKKSQRKGPATDPPEAPQPPIERRVLVSDITVEKLGALLEQNPLGLLLVRPELAAWVGAFDRYAAGGRGSDCPAWLSMYDADHVLVDRKADGGKTVFVERAAVSVVGTIQPGTLRRMFGSAEREAGLLGRIIMAYPPNRPALWTDAELPESVEGQWRDLLEKLVAIEPARDGEGGVRPRFIGLDTEARASFVAWHDRHARELGDLVNDDLSAHYSKLKGACVRLALLFTCVRVVGGGGAAASIGRDDIRRAITVAEWLKGEARRLYATFAESDEGRVQRRLAELIQRKGGVVSVRDWQRARHHRTAADAEGELVELVEAGYGRWEHDDHDGGRGRPTKRFALAGDTCDSDTNHTSLVESGTYGNCVTCHTVTEPDSVVDEGVSEPEPAPIGGIPDGVERPPEGGVPEDIDDWGEL